MFEYPSRKVAVIVEREAVESRWLTHRWELVGAVADVGGEARVIHEAPSHLQRLHPGFEVFLYPEEAEGYYLNVSSEAPSVFVSAMCSWDSHSENEVNQRSSFALSMPWLAGFLGRSIWSFEKVGVRPLRHAYAWLIRELAIDLVILVDGGIDAILRGDETSLGTPSEDLASLAAVSGLGVPARVACLGLGAELRDGIAHEQVFARIAELSRAGGYLGAEALLPGTPRGDLYRDAVAHVFAHQDGLKQSHVHKVVVAKK